MRFATYVPFEGPVAVLLKVIGPKPLMSVCAFCWGISALSMGKFTALFLQIPRLLIDISLYPGLSRTLCMPPAHRII